MALKAVGGGKWQSTFTGIGPGGAVYANEREAAKADNKAAREAAAEDRGHEILDSLSTKDMKSLILAMNGRADEATHRTTQVATATAWFAEHPEFISHASVEGTSNGAKMAGWLEAHHRNQPYSKFDLDEAYAALSEAGQLYIDETKVPKVKAAVDPADAYVSPLDVMAQHNEYRSFR